MFDVARVTHKGECDGLITRLSRAFEFHCVSVRRHPFRAGDTDRAIICCAIGRAGHVEMTAGFIEDERVAVLVKHMRRDGMRRRAGLVGQRLDREPISVEIHHDDTGGGVRRADCAAFADLRAVPGTAGMAALNQRQGRDDRGVSRPPGDNDIGACRQSGGDLLGPRKGHDIGATVDQRLVDFGCRRQRGDAPVAQGLGDGFGGLAAFQHRDLEALARRFGNLAGYPDKPVHRAVRAAGACRAKDKWHISASTRLDQPLPFNACRSPGIFRHAAAQIAGAAIGRAAIDRDDIRFRGDATIERRLVIPQPEGAGWD